MRGLSMGHLRRIYYSSVMSQRGWWSVIFAVSPVTSAVTSAYGITRVMSANVTSVYPISWMMHHFGSLSGVRREMCLLGVSDFRRVNHPAVMGQRGWWSVIISVRHVIRLGRIRWQSQRRQRETRQDNLKGQIDERLSQIDKKRKG